MTVLLIELCSKLPTTERQQIARETLNSRARRARVFLNFPPTLHVFMFSTAALSGGGSRLDAPMEPASL